MQVLHGIRVVDLSTLLPGPLATLLLAEAGADVIKIEPPEGEAMRQFPPFAGKESLNFALLNRGKRSFRLDLKTAHGVERLRGLIADADVVVEQFRPGVMGRLGLDPDSLMALNPRLIICAITGYGQQGPAAMEAGHDINYQARAGLLGLGADSEGAPPLSAALVADIAGGAYPAVMNILLALRERDRSNKGCYLDISMADNVWPFMLSAYASVNQGQRPSPGGELLTGGSPRYRFYRTRDGRFLACGALEQKFWDTFCTLIELEPEYRDDSRDPEATAAAVARIIATLGAAHWRTVFTGQEACCTVVANPAEAVDDPQFRSRGLFDWSVALAEHQPVPALPVPIAPRFRSSPGSAPYPGAGETDEPMGWPGSDDSGED